MTYSIVATDANAREVGGAGTSCVGATSVHIIYASAPGHGAVHAQASVGAAGRDEAAERLALDEDPAAIVAAITDPSFDPNAGVRQYGVVDLARRAAGFTGGSTLPYAEDRQGELGAIAYSAQGNILTSAAVLDQAIAALPDGCDLADRLMRALEAAANGEGDSRCTPDGIPSDSAFLEVDREGEPAGGYLFLDVTDTAPESPLPLLRAQYDAWRVTHPCPVPVGSDADPGGDDTGAGGCGCASTAPDGAGAVLALSVLAAIAVRCRKLAPRPRSRR
jgi:MYXO-CTERM domain-containing protein